MDFLDHECIVHARPEAGWELDSIKMHSRRLTCGDLHQIVRPALNLKCQGVALARVDGRVAVVGTLQHTVTDGLSVGSKSYDDIAHSNHCSTRPSRYPRDEHTLPHGVKLSWKQDSGCKPVLTAGTDWLSRHSIWFTRLAVVTAVDPGDVIVDGDTRVAGRPDAAAENLTVGQDAPAHAALCKRQWRDHDQV